MVRLCPQLFRVSSAVFRFFHFWNISAQVLGQGVPTGLFILDEGSGVTTKLSEWLNSLKPLLSNLSTKQNCLAVT